MKATDTDAFRAELMQIRSRLLNRSGHRMEPEEQVGADGVPDFADYAAEKAEVEVNERIAASEANLLKKVDIALQRLEEGTYNQCAECGGRIPVERLRAKPTVSLCVKCQQAKESATA